MSTEKPKSRGALLNREEYIEQEYFFRTYRERLEQNLPSQEILATIQQEILATTRLPMAIDFMRAEILHSGRISDAMSRLSHYFAPFQAYVISRAEEDEARFDQTTALSVLEGEAHYRANSGVPAGLFVYQLECIARNRLGYREGMEAMAMDPLYDDRWSQWILKIRFQLGTTELSTLIFRASEHMLKVRESQRGGTSRATYNPAGRQPDMTINPPGAIEPSAGDATTASAGKDPDHDGQPDDLILFGDQEGRIARANIGRDPFYFFAALQRQLDYPAVPHAHRADESQHLHPALEARLNKIEQRIKLVEMEQKGGIDLTRFYRDKISEAPDLPDLSLE